MKKAIWLLLLALLLSCGPSAAEKQPVANAEEGIAQATDETDEEENTVAIEALNETDEAESEILTDIVAAADFDSFVPATSVEEAAVLRPQDWKIGATDPSVVIIEYGDFQ